MIYYSQSDPKWKNNKLGNSNCTVGRYGCTTTSICSGASWFKETITPKQLASHKELYTSGGLIIWRVLDSILKSMKFFHRYYSFNEEVIDEYLIKNPDSIVILNVDRGYHWVLALKKVNGGYVCQDPYPFPSKKRTYNFSEIEGFTVFIKR